MADSSERRAQKPAATSDPLDASRTKGKKLQGGRVVQSRYLQYEKKTQKAPAAGAPKADGKPPEGRKPRVLRSREDSSGIERGCLQSTLLEGHDTTLPSLELSTINDKSMARKAPHVDRIMQTTPKQSSTAPRKKSQDLQEAMDMMESQTLLLALLTVKIENHVDHLEEKAEKELQIMSQERDGLQAQVLQLRRRLLLSQKQQELTAALDAQIEMLSPFVAVTEQFRDQYMNLAAALDTTRHELPVRGVHMHGSGEELLDALQPALRTSCQLLGELGVDPTTADASTQALDLLGELKDAIGRKDQELRRSVSRVLELSAAASKEAAFMNQEAWEEAQGSEACSRWYFSPEARTTEEPHLPQDSKPGALLGAFHGSEGEPVPTPVGRGSAAL